LVRRRCESAEVGHHAQVFRVESTAVVVGDYPNRADRFALNVNGNQQRLFNQRCCRGEVAEIAFGVRGQERCIAVQDGAARAIVARRTAALVRGPLPDDYGPVEAFLVIVQ
jgi:hypothetical protein